jgi:hypothetical protein
MLCNCWKCQNTVWEPKGGEGEEWRPGGSDGCVTRYNGATRKRVRTRAGARPARKRQTLAESGQCTSSIPHPLSRDAHLVPESAADGRHGGARARASVKRVGQLVQIDRRLTQHQGGENVIVVVAESLVATHDADATVVRRARDATVRVEAVDNAVHCASRQEQGRDDSVGAVVVKVPQKHHAPQQVRGEHRATCFARLRVAWTPVRMTSTQQVTRQGDILS